jgi:hypothetical protein
MGSGASFNSQNNSSRIRIQDQEKTYPGFGGKKASDPGSGSGSPTLPNNIRKLV